MNRMLLPCLWCVLCVSLACSSARGQGGPPPATVRIDQVKTEHLATHRMLVGDVRAHHRARIASRESGVVIIQLVDEGNPVRKDDVIATLDDRRLKQQRAQAVAERDGIVAQLKEYEADIDRNEANVTDLENAMKAGGGNEQELRDYRADLAIAQSRLSQGQNRLLAADALIQLLDLRIADMQIKAPFDGVVVSVFVEQGEWVGEGDAVVEILATDQYEVWLSVPQEHYAYLAKTEDAPPLQFQAGEEMFKSESWTAIPSVDPRSRTFDLIVRFSSNGKPVAPGMSVKAWLPTSSQRDVLTVSINAVLRNETGPYLYVMRATGAETPPVASFVPVTVLFPVNDRLAIASDQISPNDAVVTEGNERLFPGAPIAPTATQAQPAQEANTP
ncbi:MAG: efflux RND transporter periplasmic adaptor subunit [Phycisphaeraceae bacterium]|nr:efflux RND transporter periplasmic adaptor subunit [Phycisphaerales bacterium]MCB9860669.1 efflux RND transporter periplasmic adaptor subunit [Phycisphaeraceae bacterium]